MPRITLTQTQLDTYTSLFEDVVQQGGIALAVQASLLTNAELSTAVKNRIASRRAAKVALLAEADAKRDAYVASLQDEIARLDDLDALL